FHEREAPNPTIDKLCGIPQLRVVSKLHSRGLYAGHLSTLCTELTARAQLRVLGRVIAIQCGGPTFASYTSVPVLSARADGQPRGSVGPPFFWLLSVFKFQRSPAIPTRDAGVWAPGHRNTIAC